MPEGTYNGQFLIYQNGYKTPQGFGKMKYKENGANYEGWWLNGKRHGLGRIIYVN